MNLHQRTGADEAELKTTQFINNQESFKVLLHNSTSYAQYLSYIDNHNIQLRKSILEKLILCYFGMKICVIHLCTLISVIDILILQTLHL